MRIVFMGTPDFAAYHLDEIIKNGFNVVGVFSQPDKPKGRGKKIVPTPVKIVGERYKIPVFQPKSVNKKSGFEILQSLKCDLIITVAYGKILKKRVIELPVFGCFNVHASILPKYRGAAPIQRVLLNGEKETGITIFKIDEGMDSGPVVVEKNIKILPEDNFGSLSAKLLETGKKLTIDFLEKIVVDDITYKEQDHTKASYAKKICEEDLFIHNYFSLREVYNKIRAFDPDPGAKTFFEGKKIKLYGALPGTDIISGKKGEIVNITKKFMEVQCYDGTVKVEKVQFPGKKIITPWQAKSGRLLKTGDVLGG